MKITSAKFMRGIRGTDPIAYDGISQVAFVGRSNVGKSSLINALAGVKDLVKVSNKPGKTREINFFLINNKHYLVDLPGYGYAAVAPTEKEKLKKLIAWYLIDSKIHPSLVVLVIDANIGLTAFDQEMLLILRGENQPYVIAANKIDKMSRSALTRQLALIAAASQSGEVIPCSATERGGTKELLEKIF